MYNFEIEEEERRQCEERRTKAVGNDCFVCEQKLAKKKMWRAEYISRAKTT